MWTTNYRYNTIPLIAEEDTKVIMFLGVNDNGELYCPYKNMIYHLNKRNGNKKLKVKVYYAAHFWQIKNGYESFKECLKISYRICADDFLRYEYVLDFGGYRKTLNFHEEVIPFECVIPKGTQYYLNERDCIVSETIIVKEPAEYDSGNTGINTDNNPA